MCCVLQEYSTSAYPAQWWQNPVNWGGKEEGGTTKGRKRQLWGGRRWKWAGKEQVKEDEGGFGSEDTGDGTEDEVSIWGTKQQKEEGWWKGEPAHWARDNWSKEDRHQQEPRKWWRRLEATLIPKSSHCIPCGRFPARSVRATARATQAAIAAKAQITATIPPLPPTEGQVILETTTPFECTRFWLATSRLKLQLLPQDSL